MRFACSVRGNLTHSLEPTVNVGNFARVLGIKDLDSF